MGTFKAFTFATVIAANCASLASAADMLFPPLMMEAGRPGIVELGTGWYLRGDLGYVDHGKPKDGRNSIINEAFDRTKLDNSWSAGAGFGYKFLNWFRADVTGDHRFASNFEGTTSLSESPGATGARSTPPRPSPMSISMSAHGLASLLTPARASASP